MIREFRLSERGVSCDATGAFVGAIALLEKCDADDRVRWAPRDNDQLSDDLGSALGIPVDLSSKAGRLKAISNALNDGDIARAQIATVLLAIPDPPPLAKGARSRAAMIKLIRDLHWSGMIAWDGESADLAKAGYNQNEPRDEHGRWTNGENGNGQFIPAQAIVADPVIEPLIGPLLRPFPSRPDIVPPVTALDGRTLPRANPYPNKPECEEEWAEAQKFCDDLKLRGKLGKDGYRGFGMTYQQCLMGQISEECGGNPIA